jgi:hypothetical protein
VHSLFDLLQLAERDYYTWLHHMQSKQCIYIGEGSSIKVGLPPTQRMEPSSTWIWSCRPAWWHHRRRNGRSPHLHQPEDLNHCASHARTSPQKILPTYSIISMLCCANNCNNMEVNYLLDYWTTIINVAVYKSASRTKRIIQGIYDDAPCCLIYQELAVTEKKFKPPKYKNLPSIYVN